MTEFGYYTKLEHTQRSIDERAQEWQARLKWSADVQVALTARNTKHAQSHISTDLQERVSCRRDNLPQEMQPHHGANPHP